MHSLGTGAAEPCPPSSRSSSSSRARYTPPLDPQATALTYFKRFYLHNTCLNNEPLKILMTCIYLAAKVRAEGPTMLS